MADTGVQIPLAQTYAENFIEVLAQLISRLLTDRETEALVNQFNQFHQRLRSLSSKNLQLLAEEAQLKKEKHGLCKHDGKGCVQNGIRGFLKAFLVGFGLKYGLDILPYVFTGKIVSSPGKALKAGWSKDTLGLAMFLGSFISFYKVSLCSARHLRSYFDLESRDDGDRLNAFLAGNVAGLALIFERNHARRLAIATYLATRSLQFFCMWIMRRWRISRERRSRKITRVRSDVLVQHGKPKWITTEEDEIAAELDDEVPGLPIIESNQRGKLNKLELQSFALKRHREHTWEDNLDNFLSKWSSAGVMAVSSAQILFAYICAPWSLPVFSSSIFRYFSHF